MERHIQIFLNKLSFVSIAIATATLLFLFLQTPETCVDPTSSSTHPKPHHKFPKSTCEISHRSFTSLAKRNHRLWSTKTWSNTVSSYSSIFLSLQTLNFLSNHSKTLVLSAGPGHAVMSLNQLGVADVTGVELIDSPPLGALWRLASKLIISEYLVGIQRVYSLAFVVGKKHHDLSVLIKCSWHFYRTFNNAPYLKYIGLISWLSESIN